MKNDNSEMILTLIGSMMFYDEEYIKSNLSNSNLSRFQGFSKETILQSAILDERLSNESVFYMLVEDYIYNILLPSRDGHKLIIKRNDDNLYMAYIYSLNYQEVIDNENCFKKIRR